MSDHPGHDLRGQSAEQLAEWLAGRGHPAYRASQIFHWLYQRPVNAISEMKNLPAKLREELAQDFKLYLPREIKRLVSEDGAVKLLLELEDGERIEAVWMPEDGRATLCLSTQVGCRMACRFCRTGQSGFVRNLAVSEILGQVIAARALGPVTSLVFMGMGEPLDNLDNVIAALRVLAAKNAFGYAERRLTVSTIGLPGPLGRLAREAPAVNLAVSLHSAVPKTRKLILPGARPGDLDALKKALKSYPLGPRQKLTVEVTLIAGVNDTEAEARALAVWLEGLRVMVNLIPLNPFPECDREPPERAAVLAYQKVLRAAGLTAFIRVSRGRDISAACGQLRSAGG